MATQTINYITNSSVASSPFSGPPGGVYDLVANGCVGDGVYNDTSLIQTIINWVNSLGGGIVWVTPGYNFFVTQLTIPAKVLLWGHKDNSLITSQTNGSIITITGERAGVRGLRIRGNNTGSNQHGIDVAGSAQFSDCICEDIRIENMGGRGHVLREFAFSVKFDNIHVDNCNGFPFYIDAPVAPGIVYKTCYVHALNANEPRAVRVKSGSVTFDNWNGIDNSPALSGSYCFVIGKKNGVDGDTASGAAKVRFIDTNFEQFHAAGILAYGGSTLEFEGRWSFAGGNSAGNNIAIKYDNNADGSEYYMQFQVGFLGGLGDFADGTAAYSQGQPIHAAGYCPLEIIGIGPNVGNTSLPHLSTYYNTSTSSVQKLKKSGQNLVKTVLNGTTTIPNPGTNLIVLRMSGAGTITLPWSDWHKDYPEPIIIVDELGNLSSNPATIVAGSGGTIQGASSFIMNRNYQMLILIPIAGTSGDYRIAGEYIPKEQVTNTSTDLTLTSSHQTIYVTAGASTKTITLPPASASLIGKVWYVYKVDNGVGGINIAPSGANNLNGSNSTKSITNNYAIIRIECVSATAFIATTENPIV